MKLINILICLIPFMFTGISWSTCESYTMGGNWAYSTCQGVVETQCTGWLPGSSGGFEHRCCENRQNNGKCFDFYAEGSYWCYIHYKHCDTQDEVDSAKCALNPQAEGCIPPDSTWQIKSCTYVDSLNLYLNEIRDYFRISGDTSSKGISYLYPSCDTTNFDTLHVCNLSSDTCLAHSSAYRGISLKDSSVSNADTTLYYDCYYNCANNCNADSSMCTVEGNYLFDARSGASGTKVPNAFDAMRYVDNGSYEYDFLSPAAYTYVIDLLGAECSLYLYRGKLNGKYIYWYSNQEAPAGVTNVVRIK